MSTSKGFLASGAPGTKSASEEEKEEPNQNEDFFQSKLFRLITLGLYMGGVGGLGFTIALYHIFLWDSTMPPLPVLKHSATH